MRRAAISLASITVAIVFGMSGLTALAAPTPGLILNGDMKYNAASKSYEFANPDAPGGGTLNLGAEGDFDSLNPYAVKGSAPVWIGTLVFQELGDQSLDEPFSQYGALAESFDLPVDKMSLTVKLRANAKFSDGKPVTADDVVFSFKIFQSDKVAPFYKFYWADIKDVTAVDKHTVKFVFAKENPELPLITTQIPVLPKHVYETGDFGTAFATKAVGSGPYVVKEFKMGSSLILKRNPEFWGKDVPWFRGRYNFDEIVIKFYKDSTAMVEAFKKGDFDIYAVNSSKVWALDLVGDRIEKLKWIRKDLWANQNNQGSQGFMFNLRRPIFQDIKVRKALALAFDFDWSNKNLFYGQYVANESFFENSPLKATGLPGDQELAVLTPLKEHLNDEVFTKEMGWLGKGMDINQRLRTAMGFLKEAGYTVKDGVATGPGGKLEFKMLLDGPGFQRIVEPWVQNLGKLGVKVTIDEKGQSVYVKQVENREFDMIVQSVGQSQSPGNEQRDFWTTEAADQNYSRNYAGLKNKAIDALVDKIIYAKSRADLELYTRCLDRVLYHSHLQVHNWHTATHRVAYWDKFGRPEKMPPFYNVRQLMEYMWYDSAKAGKLDDAKARNAPLL